MNRNIPTNSMSQNCLICLHFQIKSYYVSTIKTISCTEMWPPIYVCNLYKFVPLLPATLFHFPKRFSWNVRMFYRSKQLIEHLNQQFKSLQAHSNRKGQRGGGGKSIFSSFHMFDQSCWRGTRRKKRTEI